MTPRTIGDLAEQTKRGRVRLTVIAFLVLALALVLTACSGAAPDESQAQTVADRALAAWYDRTEQRLALLEAGAIAAAARAADLAGDAADLTKRIVNLEAVRPDDAYCGQTGPTDGDVRDGTAIGREAVDGLCRRVCGSGTAHLCRAFEVRVGDPDGWVELPGQDCSMWTDSAPLGSVWSERWILLAKCSDWWPALCCRP